MSEEFYLTPEAAKTHPRTMQVYQESNLGHWSSFETHKIAGHWMRKHAVLEREVAALTIQRDGERDRADCADFQRGTHMGKNLLLEDQLAELRAELDAVKRALAEYGQHRLGCHVNFPHGHLYSTRNCTCGLSATLATKSTEPEEL